MSSRRSSSDRLGPSSARAGGAVGILARVSSPCPTAWAPGPGATTRGGASRGSIAASVVGMGRTPPEPSSEESDCRSAGRSNPQRRLVQRLAQLVDRSVHLGRPCLRELLLAEAAREHADGAHPGALGGAAVPYRVA